MASNILEHLKILALLLLYSLCLYSGVTHFFPDTNNNNVSIGSNFFKVDYTPCQLVISPHSCSTDSCKNSKNNALDECRDVVDKAYKEVYEKCKGYETQLITCQNHDARFCKTQQQNYVSCKNIIIKQYAETIKALDAKISA